MTVDGAKKTRNLSKQQQIDLVVKLLSQKSSLAKSVAERVEQGKTVTAQGLEFDVPVLRAALAKWEAHKSSAQLESDRPATPPCKRARTKTRTPAMSIAEAQALLEWLHLFAMDFCRPLTRAESEVFDICFPPESSLDLSKTSVAVTADLGDVDRAVAVFREHGFVVLRNALTAAQVAEVQKACSGLHEEIKKQDPEARGNRDPGRYSLGSVTPSGQCWHLRGFLHLLEQQFVHAVADAIFKGPEVGSRYVVSGAGGDYCTGSTAHFQKLHSDMRPAQPLKGQGKGYFQDAPIHSKEHPPCVAVNYIIQELTPWNGAMRIVPWRSMQQYCQARNRVELPAPGLEEEYRHCRDWLQSKIFPLQAGDCLIRDIRVWHGGCPNLSGEVRFLPSMELCSGAYHRHLQATHKTSKRLGRSLPRALHRQLSSNVQALTAHLATTGNQEADAHIDDVRWLRKDLAQEGRNDNYLSLHNVISEDVEGMVKHLQRLHRMNACNALLEELGARSPHLHAMFLEWRQVQPQPVKPIAVNRWKRGRNKMKPSSEAKTDASPPLQELSVKALKARLAQHGLDAGTCVEKAELQAMWERFETWRRRPLSELQDHCQIEGGSRFETAEECARYLTTPRQPAVRAARVAPPSAPAPAVPSAPATCSTTSPGGPAAAVDREQDAKSEAGRILPLRRESFMNPTSWGFAVLGVPTATKEVSTVQRAYRSLMRKLHPDRAGQSEDVVKAVEKVREAKEACERGLSRQEPPEPPRQLRSEALCSTPGRRRFQLCWTAPPVRESASVRRYIVAAHDPAYGRALTITVLEPDYSQELRSFVAIESLTSYVIAEEDLQKMPKLWTEKMLQVQVAAANEAGQSKWTSLK
ncbi:unnamed protein product, partial [Effrenium voratum]